METLKPTKDVQVPKPKLLIHKQPEILEKSPSLPEVNLRTQKEQSARVQGGLLQQEWGLKISVD